MLQSGPPGSEADTMQPLPNLPADEVANLLIESVYLYTQARYCILDWMQLRKWHKNREEICYASQSDSIETQTGMSI